MKGSVDSSVWRIVTRNQPLSVVSNTRYLINQTQEIVLGYMVK